MPPVKLRPVAVFEYGTCTFDPPDDDALEPVCAEQRRNNRFGPSRFERVCLTDDLVEIRERDSETRRFRAVNPLLRSSATRAVNPGLRSVVTV
jgi:hypothetical protein